MPDGSTRARERQEAWDALAHWCAERGSGDWACLRDACGQLDLEAVEVVGRLMALGHIELSWRARRWAAARPCLVQLEAPPGRLLLTGAVTADLPAVVDASLAEAAIDGEVLGPFAQGGRGPSTVQVECDEGDWAAIEKATGLPVVPQAARRLALRLPVADLEQIGVHYVPDDRFPSAPIDPDTLRPAWGRPVEPGVPAVQVLAGREKRWWVRGFDQRGLLLPGGEWAPYLLERDGDPLIRYDASDCMLRVHAAAPLPALQARAACLCSGRLPGRAHAALGQAEDRYRAVPPSVAEAIESSLRPSLAASP